MGDFLTTILHTLSETYLEHIFRITAIFLVTLGTVYIPHRMLNWKMSYRQTNTLALFAIFGWNAGLQWVFFWSATSLRENIFMIAVMGTVTCVPYVLIGWRLYRRMDKFLDKRFGKD